MKAGPRSRTRSIHTAQASGIMIDALKAAKMTRSDLAAALGVSRAFVTQILDDRNVTIDTFGRVMAACGRDVWAELARKKD